MSSLLKALLTFIVCFQTLAFAESYSYCVPVPKIDFNPYREIKDGKELAYLVLLRSYISTNSAEPGLLAKYEFSPDGKAFTAQVNRDLNWSDGTNLTAQEAADGIVKALPFRALGERVKVKKVDLLDESKFRLTFDSQIQNLTGVFREALSTNSRHNRFWPIKIRKVDGTILVLAKFPQDEESRLKFGSDRVQFLAENCKNPDFTIFKEIIKDVNRYESEKSSAPSAITLQLNTKNLAAGEREVFYKWARKAFASVDPSMNVTSVDSFFLPGEPGFSQLKWPLNANLTQMRKRKWIIGYENPLFKSVLAPAARADAINLELVPLPTSRGLDGQVLASGIQRGRHLILQDILQWANVANYLERAPESEKRLKVIAARSASTIPPDSTTLADFEKAALKEGSLVPLARRYPLAFSRKKLPLRLVFTPEGELGFAAAK